MVEIAYAAGVSPATVSRVLSDHPRVSPQTREKVLSVVEGFEYRINKHARNLRRGKATSLAIVVDGTFPSVDSAMERLRFLDELVRLSSLNDYEVRLIHTQDINNHQLGLITEELDGAFVFEPSSANSNHSRIHDLKHLAGSKIKLSIVNLDIDPSIDNRLWKLEDFISKFNGDTVFISQQISQYELEPEKLYQQVMRKRRRCANVIYLPPSTRKQSTDVIHSSLLQHIPIAWKKNPPGIVCDSMAILHWLKEYLPNASEQQIYYLSEENENSPISSNACQPKIDKIKHIARMALENIHLQLRPDTPLKPFMS